MTENLIWLLEGILLLGLVAMFFADNTGLWVRPTSQGSDDESHREISTGQ
jgi:hypothetical protein